MFYGPPRSPAGALRLQGASIMAWAALGAACKIGSTPLNRVIAVPDPAVPSVERITTASPLCRSARETVGAWLSICCKSGAPPERPPMPVLFGTPPSDVAPGGAEPDVCSLGVWPLPAPGLDAASEPAPAVAPAPAPFRRMAIL